MGVLQYIPMGVAAVRAAQVKAFMERGLDFLDVLCWTCLDTDFDIRLDMQRRQLKVPRQAVISASCWDHQQHDEATQQVCSNIEAQPQELCMITGALSPIARHPCLLSYRCLVVKVARICVKIVILW